LKKEKFLNGALNHIKKMVPQWLYITLTAVATVHIGRGRKNWLILGCDTM